MKDLSKEKRKLSTGDIDVFKILLNMKQNNVKAFLEKFLHENYPEDKIVSTDDYLYAVGDIPIALMAHMDTVWESRGKCYPLYDREQNVMWAYCGGAGFDDKAGIFAILKIIKHGFRPHIIFTTDEEVGGIGAEALAEIDNPFPRLEYIIELDRRGANDCVFYDGENTDFIEYIEHFGFKFAQGTFSDISTICPAWKVCGVNLSIGYVDEHTVLETLFVTAMWNTIDRVEMMLKAVDSLKENYFEWIGPDYLTMAEYYNQVMFNMNAQVLCKKCLKPKNLSEVMRVRSKDGAGSCFYCFDCLPKSELSFCIYCDNPFEEDGGTLTDGVCPICRQTL